MNSNTSAVCLVGKSWDFHVDVALGITNEENLDNISESAKHFVKAKKEFMFDAEHFFDGYKANPKYALSCIKAAYDHGHMQPLYKTMHILDLLYNHQKNALHQT